MASSSVVVVLTFLSFRRETEGEKEISALFLAGIPLLCFRYLHSKCGAHRGQHEQRSLRIVGLNYSLEKKTKRKRRRWRREKYCLYYPFSIDELNYYYVIRNIDAWELIHSVCKSECERERRREKKEREIQSYFVWWYISPSNSSITFGIYYHLYHVIISAGERHTHKKRERIDTKECSCKESSSKYWTTIHTTSDD